MKREEYEQAFVTLIQSISEDLEALWAVGLAAIPLHRPRNGYNYVWCS